MKIQEHNSVVTSVRLPDELNQVLEAYCQEYYRTRGEVIRQAVVEFLKKRAEENHG